MFRSASVREVGGRREDAACFQNVALLQVISLDKRIPWVFLLKAGHPCTSGCPGILFWKGLVTTREFQRDLNGSFSPFRLGFDGELPIEDLFQFLGTRAAEAGKQDIPVIDKGPPAIGQQWLIFR